MKIIGNIGRDKFIAVIGKDELEKLTGYYYNRKEFKVGDVLLIDALFRQLDSLKTQAQEIKEMVHALKTAAGILEKIDPVFYPTKANK